MDLGKMCHMDGKYFLTIKGFVKVKKEKLEVIYKFITVYLKQKNCLLLHYNTAKMSPG